MKVRTFALCIIIISLFSIHSVAQTDSVQLRQFQAAFVPHYALMDGIRLDFEYKLKNKNQYLQFAPRFYFDSYEDEFFGVGLGIFHKSILNKSKSRIVNTYVSYGGDYTHYILETREQSEKYPSESFRLNVSLGVQINIVQSLFIDFYVGSGFTYSFNDQDEINYADMYDPEFSGIYIPVGFRFGAMF